MAEARASGSSPEPTESQQLALPLPWPCLHPAEIGGRLVRAAVRRSGLCPPPMSCRDVLRWALVMDGTRGGPTPTEALALVMGEMTRLGGHSPQSVQRLATETGLFVARLELLGIETLALVDQDVVQDFIDEAVPEGTTISRTWAEPALGTRHFRRSAVRGYFRVARLLGLCDHDPTADILLPPRSSRSTRPLTDEEVLEGEAACQYTLLTTRLPAAWALAEATAVTSEIAAAQVCDLDLEHRRVWLHGCGKRVERWGELTEWGVEALARRAKGLNEPASSTAPLVYGAGSSPKSGQAATCDAVRDGLIRAGLHRERDVRPASVAAWGGARVLRRTGRIEDVARAMGLGSLDQAARAVGYDWDSG
jgi:integrase